MGKVLTHPNTSFVGRRGRRMGWGQGGSGVPSFRSWPSDLSGKSLLGVELCVHCPRVQFTVNASEHNIYSDIHLLFRALWLHYGPAIILWLCQRWVWVLKCSILLNNVWIYRNTEAERSTTHVFNLSQMVWGNRTTKAIFFLTELSRSKKCIINLEMLLSNRMMNRMSWKHQNEWLTNNIFVHQVLELSTGSTSAKTVHQVFFF